MSPQAPECREDCAEQSASLYEAEGLKSDVEPLYNIQRYYAEAELLYQRSLAIREKALGARGAARQPRSHPRSRFQVAQFAGQLRCASVSAS